MVNEPCQKNSSIAPLLIIILQPVSSKTTTSSITTVQYKYSFIMALTRWFETMKAYF